MCNRCHYFNDNNVANYDSQHFFWMPLCTKSKLKTIQLLTYSFSNFSKLNMLCFTKSQSKGIYDFIERKWTLTKMKNKLSVAFYCVLKFRLSYLYDASTKSFISKPSNRHQKYLRVLFHSWTCWQYHIDEKSMKDSEKWFLLLFTYTWGIFEAFAFLAVCKLFYVKLKWRLKCHLRYSPKRSTCLWDFWQPVLWH